MQFGWQAWGCHQGEPTSQARAHLVYRQWKWTSLWGWTGGLEVQNLIYQDYGSICQVFHHSEDILHPVAELQLIHLKEKHQPNKQQVKKRKTFSRLQTYIASKFWRATSTLMIIEHTGMVVYRAVSEQKVKVFLLQCCCLLLHLIKQWALCPSMCVYSCSPGTLAEVVLIERMTLLNESKESKGQDLFMLELL